MMVQLLFSIFILSSVAHASLGHAKKKEGMDRIVCFLIRTHLEKRVVDGYVQSVHASCS